MPATRTTSPGRKLSPRRVSGSKRTIRSAAVGGCGGGHAAAAGATTAATAARIRTKRNERTGPPYPEYYLFTLLSSNFTHNRRIRRGGKKCLLSASPSGAISSRSSRGG